MSWSCVTPFYVEDVIYSRADLEHKNEDGLTTLMYMQVGDGKTRSSMDRGVRDWCECPARVDLHRPSLVGSALFIGLEMTLKITQVPSS